MQNITFTSAHGLESERLDASLVHGSETDVGEEHHGGK